MNRFDTIYVQFAFKKISGEVCINGIPVWTVPEDVGATDQTIPINGYVVAGLNQLELVLDIQGSPSTCRTPRRGKAPAGGFASVRVIRMPSGRGPMPPSPSTGSVLLEREWNGDKDDTEDCPRWVSGSFDVPGGFGRWSWQSAPKLELDVKTVEEARVVCEQIRSALRAGDTRELLKITEVRFKELGEAVGATSDAEDIAQLERWIQQYKSEPDRVLPLDPANFDFRVVGNSQLLVPLEKDWKHVIKLRQTVKDQHGNPVGDHLGRYTVMLARVGDGLRVVR